jgi:WD40 repeat protein
VHLVFEVPLHLQVKLQGHYKLVSAIDIDRAGARVLTGGMDYNVHLYDFNGMKADGKPFRELMPQDGHPVNAVSFSPSGDAFICITGEPRAKVCKGHLSFFFFLCIASFLFREL